MKPKGKVAAITGGGVPFIAPAPAIGPEDWNRVVGANPTGLFCCSRQANSG